VDSIDNMESMESMENSLAGFSAEHVQILSTQLTGVIKIEPTFSEKKVKILDIVSLILCKAL
jgi:hypothetical protein